MLRIKHIALTLFLTSGIWLSGRCDHYIGGEITWACQGGGQYIFTMKVYRDCNGSVLNTTGLFLRVWNHPAMSTIPVSLVSQTEISPSCTQVAGGPAPITCATPSPGAVQEYIFQSPLVFMGTTPPAQGWAFTFDNFARSAAITNLNNPTSYGITLRAIMYPYNGQNGNPCYDSSPQFLEKPTISVCATVPFAINHNAFDPDGDSLVFSFAQPLDRISVPNPMFNPPVSPQAVPFNTGFSVTSPTPNSSFGPGNVGSTIDPQNGEITFTSSVLGTYVMVVKVEAWRCGQKIAEVYREMQVVVQSCAPNAAPVVAPPFSAGTSFSTTVVAGTLVNFTLTATDNGMQPNGSPQIITIQPSGGQFGALFTSTGSGCNAPPCAVLNSGGPFTGVGSVSVNFSWQTDCSHISGLTCGGTSNTHTFVFKVSDDACPVPAVKYYTVTITVLPQPAAIPASLHCADVAPNGDVTLSWQPAIDPLGTFDSYEIYYNGLLLNTIGTIGTTTFTHVGADADLATAAYFIKTLSGCMASETGYSDTVQTMFLTVNNPGTGTAVLQWNALHTPLLNGNQPVYYIYQEYPLGTWNVIDTIPYGVNSYVDTISICYDTLNYKIQAVDASGCVSFSSIDGDYFQDVIEPYVPLISFVTVDTTTGQAQITWNVNDAADTEGYIILQQQGSNWIVIDTVYGIGNTSYTWLLSNAGSQSENYGVSAFDSCWWGNPPGPNTTGMSVAQNTIYVQNVLSVCDSSVTLSWNAYNGWNSGVLTYEVWASENGNPYVLVGSVNSLSFVHAGLNRNSTYRYVIKAISVTPGIFSLSNITTRFIKQPQLPAFGYLKVATVSSPGVVTVRYQPDVAASVSGYILDRSDDGGYTWYPRTSVGPSGGIISFTDDAATDEQSFLYRVRVIDSCGKINHTSNVGQTIHLSAVAQSPELINSVNWNKYIDWSGNVLEYRLYRSVNGVYSATPIAVINSAGTSYSDDMYAYIQSTGEFCYYVAAVETANPGGQNEISVSNEDCAVQEPLVYIPNAFTPGGNNPLFIPVMSYYDFNTYVFRIFNRMGELIFETTDYTVAWDGTHRSQIVKEGVYVYTVGFKTGEGKPVEIRGFVTLLRAPGQ